MIARERFVLVHDRPNGMPRLNGKRPHRLRRLAAALVDVQLRDEKANRTEPYGVGAWWSR
jgi:hypothetical protein